VTDGRTDGRRAFIIICSLLYGELGMLWKGEVATRYRAISGVCLEGLSKTTRDLRTPCFPAEVPTGYDLDIGKKRQTPFSLVHRYQCFGGNFCIYLQGRRPTRRLRKWYKCRKCEDQYFLIRGHVSTVLINC
jgi:hypothetical protein